MLQDHRIGLLGVGGDLVEVEVAVSICRSGIERLGVLQVLRHGRDLAEDGGNGGQLRRGQIDVGTFTQTVREVTGGSGDHRGSFRYPRLVTHAEGAARDLDAGTDATKDAVVALFGQLILVHLGGRRDPHAGRQLALILLEQFAGGTEVTDVGHAGTDEHFVDLVASHVAQQTGIVRIVRRTEDRLLDGGQIDLDDFGVLGILVRFHQGRVGQPLFHPLDATGDGAYVAVAFGEHPFQHHDVGLQILDDRLFIQLDGATGSGALGAGVRQLECLLHLQGRQTFDLEDAAGEDVLLASFLDGQQPLLDGGIGDGMNQITQGDARLQLALEAHQHGLRHVQRHHAGSSGESHQTGARREGDTDGETGVGVTTGTHGIRQQHAVQPGVDDAVTRTQAHTAAVHDEVRQGVVGLHVDGLGISRGVAEGLHGQIGGEAEAGQIFELVAGHRARGILGADRGHLGLAVSARANALHAARLAHHLLGQGEAFTGIGHRLRATEYGGERQTQCFAGLVSQAATDDQRDTATGAHFVDQHVGFQFKLRQHLFGAVFADLAGIGVDVDHIAHFQLGDIHFDGQSAGIFHGVEEDRGNLATQTDTASALVRHERNVVAHKPEHRVGGGFTGRTGTDHVTHIGQREPLLFQGLDGLDGANRAILVGGDAWTSVFQHRQGVQRNIRAGPGVRRRREVVGVGFAGHLEHGDGDLLGQLRAGEEPLGISPGLHHLLGVDIARLGLLFHVVEGVKHQQGVGEPLGGKRRQSGVIQQVDQRLNVVTTLHGAQQLNGFGGSQDGRVGFALSDGGEETGFDIGRFINTGGNTGGQQLFQKVFFASGRVLEKFYQGGDLLCIQRLGNHALGGTFCDVFTVCFKHD